MSRVAERAARLLEDFHSRPVKTARERKISLPSEFVRVGTGISVSYKSDKRDPADPEGEGRQGVMKEFIHEHDSGKIGIYQPCDGVMDRADLEVNEWPEAVVFLGKLIEVHLIDDEGVERTEPFRGWGLWAWPDGKVLWGLPSRGSMMLLWSGPGLTTTWRGIEG